MPTETYLHTLFRNFLTERKKNFETNIVEERISHRTNSIAAEWQLLLFWWWRAEIEFQWWAFWAFSLGAVRFLRWWKIFLVDKPLEKQQQWEFFVG